MSLSEEDKKWLKENCEKDNNFLLYVMVFLILLNSCAILDKM